MIWFDMVFNILQYQMMMWFFNIEKMGKLIISMDHNGMILGYYRIVTPLVINVVGNLWEITMINR